MNLVSTEKVPMGLLHAELGMQKELNAGVIHSVDLRHSTKTYTDLIVCPDRLGEKFPKEFWILKKSWLYVTLL
jgi:hypothetical protein